MRRRGGLLLALALLLPGPVAAQMEEPPEWLGIPSGALDIPEVPGLTLDSLTLTLAAEQVKATYLLVNAAEVVRVLAVGFPVPRQRTARGEGPPLGQTFLDAALVQDGAPLPSQGLRVRVFMHETEVTDILAAAGIDLEALADGGLEAQPRSRARAMHQALIDAGVPIDPAGWRMTLAPLWRVEIAPRSTTRLTLTYRPYPGYAVDRLAADEELEDLAHLAGYCAEADPELLPWLQALLAGRAAAGVAALLAEGLPPDDPRFPVYADIERLDLSFLWNSGPWPARFGTVKLIVDPGPGRAVFCAPGNAGRTDDGLYRGTLEDQPAEGSLDILFLR